MKNLQSPETITNQKQTMENNRENWLKIVLLFLAELILLAGAFYTGIKFTKNKQTQKPKDIKKLSLTPTIEPSTATMPTISVLPSPTQATQTYPRPANWKTVTIPSMKISLCLPPKWEIGSGHYPNDYIEIFFERDPVYRPRATSISKIPYQGGSRREEYINSKVQYEHDPEKLKKETIVKEVTINGKSVLDIAIPSFPEELVFVIGNYIYAVDVDYKNLVNDSRSDFRKDIYTIVGCITPI